MLHQDCCGKWLDGLEDELPVNLAWGLNLNDRD
jgi:hypothetical protein